jgi:hypothetical protein
MRRLTYVLIGVVVLVLAGIFGVHYALNSEAIVTDVIHDYVTDHSTDLRILDLTIEDVRFLYPLNFSLSKVRCDFAWHGEKGTFTSDNVNFFVKGLFRGEKTNPYLTVDGANLSLKDLSARDLYLFGHVTLDDQAAPPFEVESVLGAVEAAGYSLTNLKFTITGDGKVARMDDFVANAYGGQLTTRALCHYARPDMAYEMTATLAELDLYELEKANPSVFSQVRARVNGHLAVAGDRRQIVSLECRLEDIDGAMIKAALMKKLMNIVSQSLGKDLTAVMRTDDNQPLNEALDALIKVDGSVPLEEIKFRAKTQGAEEVQSFVSFESDQFNVNIDSLTIDTRVEGGYQALFRFL